MSIQNIGIIGFGEVGQTLAIDLIAASKNIFAYDIKFEDENSISFLAAKKLGINICNNANEVAKKADLIICAVTAAQTLNAANSINIMLNGQYYLDVNSASPATKIEAAKIINSFGGRYIEASIMSPIAPKNINSPILLGGNFAKDAEKIFIQTGFKGAKFYSKIQGKTAATKLCRSVMIKGLEALISESMLAAYHYGVEEEVLASLNNLFPHEDWKKYAHYMITRTLEHGIRRSEEMVEAAKTVKEAGIEPIMSEAIAKRQLWAANYKNHSKEVNLDDLIREIRQNIKEENSL